MFAYLPYLRRLSRKRGLKPNGNLDDVLGNLKTLDSEPYALTEFELEIIEEAKRCL
jgi:hypothetical protein